MRTLVPSVGALASGLGDSLSPAGGCDFIAAFADVPPLTPEQWDGGATF